MANRKKIVLYGFLILIGLLVSSFINVYIPNINKKILDIALLNGSFSFVIYLCLALLMLSILNSGFKMINNILITKLGIDCVKYTKEKYINKTLKFSMNFFDRMDSGELSERIKEIDNISLIFTPTILSIITTVISAIGAIIIIANINPLFLLIYLIFIPVIGYISIMTAKKYYGLVYETAQLRSELGGKMQESFQGIAEIKSLNLIKEKTDSINLLNKKLYKNNLKQNITFTKSSEAISIINIVASIIATLICVNMYDKKQITAGDYVAILQYSGIILAPAQMMSSIYMTFQPVLATLKRLEFFSVVKEQNIDKGTKIGKIKNISVKNLTFSYTNKELIKNINFDLKKKDILVIKGENGSGKTTLVKLLMGLYDDYQGEIYYNEKSLRDLSLRNIRDEIAIVFQETFLFTGTLKENMVAGNKEASIQEIVSCLQKVGLIKSKENEQNDILNLPILDGGKNLSGGQKRRIAIARSLLRKPSVLILDEPTTYLDEESQNVVYDLINNKSDEYICIIISHNQNLSLLEGKHMDLVKENNYYTSKLTP